MKKLKILYLIIMILNLIPLYSWSQDSIRCYNRMERELIASHNIERLWCLEELEYLDAITVYQDSIISTQHIHLDHHNCLEVIVAKGKAKDIQNIADKLKSVRGVKHVNINMATIGKDLV